MPLAIPRVTEGLTTNAALIAFDLQMHRDHMLVQVALLRAAVVTLFTLEQLLAEVDGREMRG